jgi:hypothetical protein
MGLCSVLTIHREEESDSGLDDGRSRQSALVREGINVAP